jgi:hypothetical protein
MVVGSYDYSMAARCFNGETIFIAETREDDILHFDAVWGDLEDRALSIFNPTGQLFSAKEQDSLADV